LNPRLARSLPALVAALVPVALGAALHGPWLLDVAGTHPVSAFGASHVWGLDRLMSNVLLGRPFETDTRMLAFPRGGEAPMLGLGPALLALPVRGVLDALQGYAFALFACLALAGALAWAWLRRLGAAPWPAAAGAVVFGTSPAMLNNLALGNIDKLAVWVYPGWLLAASLALEHRFGLLFLPLVALFGFLAAMTEPYLGLFLPLACVPVLIVTAARQPFARWPRIAVLGVLTTAITAASMLPARTYYAPYASADRVGGIFRPAAMRLADAVGVPLPWARPEQLFRAPVAVPADPEEAFHVFYVGAVGLVAGLVLAALPGVRRRAEGVILVVVGVVLALGPYMVVEGGVLRLPVTLLEEAGYPTRAGSQYYRALPLAALGYGALIAVGLSARRSGGRAALWALLPLACILDSVRSSQDAWPRPLREVPCRAVLSGIAATPGVGAVFNLNLRASQAQNGEAMMLATLHRRPIQTIPVHTPLEGIDPGYNFVADLRAATDAGEIARSLHREGFRFLLDAPVGVASLPLLAGDAMEAALGAPTWRDGACRAWDLGPLSATPAPRQPAQPGPGPRPDGPAPSSDRRR
jgi:hypothetical protein